MTGEEFMAHVIDKHGFDDTPLSWMNLPTNRGYHDFLHRNAADRLDHTHPSDQEGSGA